MEAETITKNYRMKKSALEGLDKLVAAKRGKSPTQVLHVLIEESTAALDGQPSAARANASSRDTDDARALREENEKLKKELSARPRGKKADGPEVAALRAELEELRLTNESLRDTNKKLMAAVPAEALTPDRPEPKHVKEPGIDQTAARADVQPVAVAQPITEYMDPVTKKMVKYEAGPGEF